MAEHYVPCTEDCYERKLGHPGRHLRQGYYCGQCGKSGANMYGMHSGECIPNPERVRQVDEVNLTRGWKASVPLVSLLFRDDIDLDKKGSGADG